MNYLSVNILISSYPFSPSLSLLPPLSPSMSLTEWEHFEDSQHVSKKILSSAKKEAVGGGGAVCAADAMVSDSQWTALDDSRHREMFGKWEGSVGGVSDEWVHNVHV